jgi:hypothetical protein
MSESGAGWSAWTHRGSRPVAAGYEMEGDDNRLVCHRQHRGYGVFGTGGQVGHRVASLPLGDGLRVDPVALSQGSEARSTMLNCSTDCLCRCVAAVEDLVHGGSFRAA